LEPEIANDSKQFFISNSIILLIFGYIIF
jgi:hypothetical protein